MRVCVRACVRVCVFVCVCERERERERERRRISSVTWYLYKKSYLVQSNHCLANMYKCTVLFCFVYTSPSPV